MPASPNDSGLRDNYSRSNVADFLRTKIRDGSQLSVMSACLFNLQRVKLFCEGVLNPHFLFEVGLNRRMIGPTPVDEHGTRWLLESKGAETEDVAHKDAAATQWCENATQLSGTKWQYLKVPQKAFDLLQPNRLQELKALAHARLL